MKYHINLISGNVNECKAQFKCRFNFAEDEHFQDKQEAKEAAEEIMEKSYGLFPDLLKNQSLSKEELSKLKKERETCLKTLHYFEVYGEEGKAMESRRAEILAKIEETTPIVEEFNNINNEIAEAEEHLVQKRMAEKSLKFAKTNPIVERIEFDKDEYHLFERYDGGERENSYSASDRPNQAHVGSTVTFEIAKNSAGEEMPGGAYAEGLRHAETLAGLPPEKRYTAKQVNALYEKSSQLKKDNQAKLNERFELKEELSAQDQTAIENGKTGQRYMASFMKKRKLATIEEAKAYIKKYADEIY